MVVPQKSVPALLLFATVVAADADNLLDRRDSKDEQASEMFQAASRLATVVKASTGMTRGNKVDSKVIQDSVVCPLAEDVADMVSKALEEAGDSPEGKTRGMMNKLVGISRGVDKTADKANVSCNGLSKLKSQSNKVKSAIQKNRKRDTGHKYDTDTDNSDTSDTSESDTSDDGESDTSDDETTDDDSDDSDIDEDEYTTATALAVSNKKWMGVYKGVEHMKSLPNDYLCDSIGSAAESVDKMNKEVGSSASKKTKNLVDHGVVKTGKQFTSSAKDNGIKCDSQLSSLNKALNKKANGASSSSGSARVSSLSTKAAASKTGSSSSSPSAAAATSSSTSSSTQDAESAANRLSTNPAYFGAGAAIAWALL
ncbi:hypothetical protein TRICI_005279 [Trichomonascus ciferrii]|uniref:Cell wall protein n=1 Tax=Trichomonascus ciferrii TaxID=44093 RepID=A0A642UU79_9ASCO|nr:hypothetical protein TRICI_005279 [Trichomonascus ciferrii]